MAEKKYTIIQGDSAQELKNIPDNTIDAVITDPPYGIEFLGKAWDSNTGAVAIWQQCHRILKPGGHLLAFSAARTYHHLATNIETVGFEIRDQLMWIYSSGFPKAQDMGKAIQKRLGVKETRKNPWASKANHRNKFVDNENPGHRKIAGKDPEAAPGSADEIIPTSAEAKQWAGWKTALKPGHEPIVMARKRFKGSTIDNIQQQGVGALNIDATRIPFQDAKDIKSAQFGRPSTDNYSYINTEAQQTRDNLDVVQANPEGRYPSNVMGLIPDYQKYFYCPKVSRKERHMGVDSQTISAKEMVKEMGGYFIDGAGKETTEGSNMYWVPHLGAVYGHGLSVEYDNWHKARGTVSTGNTGNNHPTVKPVALMRYLIQLVTPANSHIVDPFTGSGTTGMAATELGHRFTGIEQDPHYVTIANKRIEGWPAMCRK